MAKNNRNGQQYTKNTAARVSTTARDRLAQETGAIRKEWGGRLPVALVFPNTYYIGMSSLGFQTIYRLFNERAGRRVRARLPARQRRPVRDAAQPRPI